MKHLYTSLITVLVFTNFCHAQNFKPGYILNTKGDTVKGLVDYREWTRAPVTVPFKKSGESTINYYGSTEIAGFGINGLESYRAYDVSISQGQTEIEKASSMTDTSTITSIVFLKQIVMGDKVNLFQYTDLIKTRYYIQTGMNSPVELLYYVSIKNSRPIYSYRYRNQLSLLADNSAVASGIETAGYSEAEISKIVRRLNNKTIDATSKFAKSSIQFFVGAGASIGLLTFSGQGSFSGGATVTSNPGIYIDAGIDIYTNATLRNAFFRIEMANISSSNKAVSAPVSNQLTSSTYHDELSTTRSSISLIPQFGYNFISSKAFTFGATAGIGFNMAYNNKNSVIRYNTNAASTPTDITSQMQFPAFTTNVAVIGLEAMFNNSLGVYVKYRLASQFNSNGTDDYNLGYFIGGLSYHF